MTTVERLEQCARRAIVLGGAKRTEAMWRAIKQWQQALTRLCNVR